MVKTILMFNHKGGVSKTTTTFNLGMMLEKKGKSVIIADLDPQCNLTGMVLDIDSNYELQERYEEANFKTIKRALEPAFEGTPERIKPVDVAIITPGRNIGLLPGDIDLAEYEISLGIAQELSGSLNPLRNIPGSIHYLLEETAKKANAEYIIIDTSPSLSALNRNLFACCDYFIIPTTPDFYSVMAINSLAKILPDWKDWTNKALESNAFKNAVYPIPNKNPKFLGTIIQNYRPRSNRPTKGFQHWIDTIINSINGKFKTNLANANLLLDPSKYPSQIAEKYVLSQISDFNTLITLSQKYKKPIFELTNDEIGLVGKALSRTADSRDRFDETFSDLTQKIINLTN